MGNVIHRGKGSFTHVENTVFFDRELSLKAKGIYCQIRSLEGNPEWVFTIRGFASLVKDGVDSVSAGIRELESAGYVIRARRRGEAGRFLKAEEATWITLDDPAMHDSVADELRAEGFAILSEFVRKDRAPNAREAEEEGRGAEKAQVVPRTGKSVSGPATSGKATSGKPRSGEPGAINYSWDKAPESNQRPLSSSPVEGGSEGEGGFEPYRRGEFPEEFERLCAMSIKPVASLRFKRSCLAAWEKRVAEGYLPAQIADAYGAYAESYRGRNGEDGRLAKNLARWLEGDDGMPVWSDDPIPPDALGCDGESLDMEGLAKADQGSPFPGQAPSRPFSASDGAGLAGGGRRARLAGNPPRALPGTDGVRRPFELVGFLRLPFGGCGDRFLQVRGRRRSGGAPTSPFLAVVRRQPVFDRRPLGPPLPPCGRRRRGPAGPSEARAGRLAPVRRDGEPLLARHQACAHRVGPAGRCDSFGAGPFGPDGRARRGAARRRGFGAAGFPGHVALTPPSFLRLLSARLLNPSSRLRAATSSGFVLNRS